MNFTETSLKGAFLVELNKLKDDRGFFARGFCRNEFEQHGIEPFVAQVNISMSVQKGTLRGIHYQVAPHEETKLIRCTRGSVYDVIIDLRPDSATYRQWIGVDLTEDNYRMLFLPRGFGHGFLTTSENAEVTYMVSEFYTPGAERGIRWNDPAIGIDWPANVNSITEKDANWPLLNGRG